MTYLPRHAKVEYTLASRVEILRNHFGGHDIFLDGEPLEFHLASEGPQIETDFELELHKVWLPILVDGRDGGITVVS